MARALDMTQGNVSFLERGATVTPEAAKKLVLFAARLRVRLNFNHIYGDAKLPAPRRKRPRRVPEYSIRAA
jgi:transcriptional regulator